jgi:hypothetical protein
VLSWFASISEALLLLPIAIVASWLARATIRTLTRRAVRRAQRRSGTWRVRLDRLGDNGQADARKRQRADAVARMLGHVVTVAIFTLTTLVALEWLGVDLVFAISSAGFIMSTWRASSEAWRAMARRSGQSASGKSVRLRAAISRPPTSSFICRCRNSTRPRGSSAGRLVISAHVSRTSKRASRAGPSANSRGSRLTPAAPGR